jgi:hypothetical protein
MLSHIEGSGSKRVREQNLQAVINGYAQDYDDLARFFERAIEARADL